MPTNSIIKYLKHDEIDRTKWDECIRNAGNSLIYAYSFYLDAMCAQCHALTNEDYSWVLPLTYKRKFGIRYLYQPPFTQQLGVFSGNDVIVPYKEIIDLMQNKFRFWEINWNYKTSIQQLPSTINLNSATNFILDLNQSYKDIASNYHNDLKKNLKNSNRLKLSYQPNNYKHAMELYIKNYSNRMPHVKPEDYNNFDKVCNYASNNNMLVCREAIDDNKKTVAIVLLLKDGKRLYNLMNTTTAEGRKVEANHFLIDSIIEEFAGKKLLLDFEGSDLPGVKHFYQNFGAVNQPFFMLKYNKLPAPLQLIKK